MISSQDISDLFYYPHSMDKIWILDHPIQMTNRNFQIINKFGFQARMLPTALLTRNVESVKFV